MKNRLFRKITISFAAFALFLSIPLCSWDAALAASDGPDIKGTSAMIYCSTTDEVIWQNNPDKKHNLASITKLMTCLIAIEELGLDKEVTVAAEAVQASWDGKSEPVGIAGEKLTVEELVYEAMLVSANDAASSLGIAVSGSEKKFAKLMNERAQKIGCSNTNFVNASGIEVKNQYSSAADVIKIACEAFSNKDLLKIVGTAHHTVPKTNKSEARELENSNLFLEGGEAKTGIGDNTIKVKKYPGVFGGKTGTTLDRKATMVVGCDFDGLEIYAVVLDSTVEKRYSDVRKLLDYAKENLSRYEVFAKGAEFEKGRVKSGAVNKITGIAAEAGIINLPEGASASLLTSVPVYDEDLTAPVKKGQKIGVIQIYLADDPVRTIDLLAAKEVKKGWFLSSFGITNMQTVVIIAVLLLTAAFFVMIMMIRTSNKRKREAARRAKLKKLAKEQMERENDYRQRNWPY